ncbi:serine protease, partial [Clostridium botulinum CFSAN001627]
MSKINCTIFDKKSNKLKNVGFMEIKNSSNGNGELYLYGDIVSDQWGKWSDDDTCPQDVANFLKELNSFDSLDIYINSGGGSVFAGIAIYHQLKRHNGFKTVHIDGIAASITSVISCAGDKVII